MTYTTEPRVDASIDTVPGWRLAQAQAHTLRAAVGPGQVS
jgi:hypothetical protein